MKKSAVYAMLLLGATSGSALGVPAGVILYQDTVEVYDVLDGRLPGPPAAEWQHRCDIPLDSVESATLTIVAEGVDSPDEMDPVWFNGHLLGNLDQQGFEYDYYDILPGPGALGFPQTELTTSVFTLDPSWLDTLNDVRVQVGAIWIVEVETSTLSVTQIPEPGTILLLGLGGLGLLRKSGYASDRR